MNKEQLLKTQPTLSRFFKTAREKNRLPHAMLLYGDKKAPLLEIATYLAKSINCEKDIFACGECLSCTKFEKGIHPDFVLIDGAKKMIVKENIDNLEEQFQLGSTETNKTIVYILNEVQNINKFASNALLKFLEEPKVNIVAILTTSNIAKVLPTIHSRCIPIYVLNDSHIYDYCYEKTNNEIKSYVLAEFSGDKSVIDELIEDDEFNDVLEATKKFINVFIKNPYDSSFVLLNDLAPEFKSPKCYNYFYKILSIFIFNLIRRDRNIFNVDFDLYPINENLLKQILEIVENAIAQSIANPSFVGVLGRICQLLIS